MSEPIGHGPARGAPVEAKVITSSLAALAAAAVVAVLNAAVADSALLGALPGWVQFAAVTVVPPLVTLLSGYAAPHSPRPPLEVPHPRRGPLPERGPHRPGENDA